MTRQFLFFIVVGLTQYVIDGLSLYLLLIIQTPVAWANIVSRGIAACIGYYLNAKLTFSNTRVWDFAKITRFALFWSGMTVISTVSLIWLNSELNQQGSDMTTLAIKLTVEAVLVTISFLGSKYLVFRDTHE